MLSLKVVNGKEYKEEENVVFELFSEITPKLRMLWGIESKGNIQIYLNKSQTLFLLRTLPFYKALLLILTFPLWYVRSKQNIKPSKGIIRERAGKYFVLLTPIDLNRTKRSPLEEKLFYRYPSPASTFERNACNILVGVFASPIMLPYWLENGFVIFCGDILLDNKFLKNDSLMLFKDIVYEEIVDYSSGDVGKEEFAYNYVKGYWTVRYLEEEYPGFLKETFKSYKGTDVVRVIGKKLGLDTTDNEKMWIQLDELLYNHFEYLLATE